MKLREDKKVLKELEKWWNLVVKDLTHRTDEAGGLLRTSTRPTFNFLLLLHASV
jgi:hypothetical protein